MNKITVDATNKKLGRLASEVARILLGKASSDYSPNSNPKIKVEVINVSKIDISDAKMDEFYTRYSGYPGGLKYIPRRKVAEKHGMEEVVRMAVKRMLPSNKLRKPIMKNLIIVK